MRSKTDILHDIGVVTQQIKGLAVELAGAKTEKTPDAKPMPKKPQSSKGSAWYPLAKKNLAIEYKSRGEYIPKGATIHFSASSGGNSPDPITAEKYTIRVIKYLAKMGYAAMQVDCFGKTYQNMSLLHWGFHAGKSKWRGMTGLNNDAVGIELVLSGKLKLKNGKLYTWFNKEVLKEHAFHVSKSKDNVVAGWYEKCTQAQFDALTELLLWLEHNFDEFSFDNVAGHDEVSPGRKTDPGGSLINNGELMTMPMYRKYLKELKAKRMEK